MPKTLPKIIDKNTICLVAIVKDEEKFLDEWLIYHRMLGIQHFFLYDDDPAFPLADLLSPHAAYCTTIPWRRYNTSVEKQGNQVKAYQHAWQNHIMAFEWVVFLDVDEFIVLRKHKTITQFIAGCNGAVSISLNWHVFGHNGFFDDPERLITSSLTRRMLNASKEIKTITKTQYIAEIDHPHYCQLKDGIRVDANNEVFKSETYPGRTKVAHINHYHCRSFNRWMQRPDRGDVNFDHKFSPPEHKWRLSKETCLKTFVTTVAKTHNEYIDRYMFKYRFKIHDELLKLKHEHRNLSIPVLTPRLTTTINNQLKAIANMIIANNTSVENTGLLYGKTGLAVFLLNYYGYTQQAHIKRHALKIIDEIAEQIDINSIADYANGLAGYGTAIEYAVEKGFLKIDTNEILENLDLALHYNLVTHAFSGVNLYTGVAGIGKYYISRLNNPFNEANHKHDKKNIEIIEEIIDLFEAAFDTYEDCLSSIHFLSNAYIHCSQQRTKINHYINYAADKLETMFYEDVHFNIQRHDFNPLGAVSCLLKAYDITGEEMLCQKAMDLAARHQKYYDGFIETALVKDGRLDHSKWLLYLQLANAFQHNDFENNFNKWLEEVMQYSTKLLDRLNTRSPTNADLDLFTGVAGMGMTLLAILRADDRDVLKLFPF